MKKFLTFLAIFFLATAPLVSTAQNSPLDRNQQRDDPQAAPAPTLQPNQGVAPQQSAGVSPYTFTPLTNLPGINDAVSSDSLPTFFNNLYKLCIGAAAVIAVIQIMRAGMYFMFNKGSVAHNEKAKTLISSAVLGLLLVLSPYIVFSIINPDILELRLNTSGLATDPLQRLTPGNRSGVGGAVDIVIRALREAASRKIDEILGKCQLSATDLQKSCLIEQAITINRDYGTCVAPAGTNTAVGTAATCISRAETQGIAAVNGCLGIRLSEPQISCLRPEVVGLINEMRRIQAANAAI